MGATTSSAGDPAGLAAGAVILVAIMVIAAWCVPLVIAALFGLPRKGSIAVLSLALGWTGVAWLAALIIVTVGAILANREYARAAPAGPQYIPPAGPPWTPPPPPRPDPYGARTSPAGREPRTGPSSPSPGSKRPSRGPPRRAEVADGRDRRAAPATGSIATSGAGPWVTFPVWASLAL